MTGHLSRDELVDLAEGTRARDAVPHLDACESCRGRLAQLQAAMFDATSFEVPEPSPLFWDRLTERVREAVQAEGPPPGRSAWFDWFFVGRYVYPLAGGALAAVLVAFVLAVGGGSPPVPASASRAGALEAPAALDVLSDDPTLGLVVDLAADMDWDAARAAGLTSEGSAEYAVTHLDDADLRQLQSLLQQELTRPGA